MLNDYEPRWQNITASCSKFEHEACSSKVVKGLIPLGKLGHFESCGCDCHDSSCEGVVDMDWRTRTECGWKQAFKGTLERTRFRSDLGGPPLYICKFCGRWLKSRKSTMAVSDVQCRREGCKELAAIDEPAVGYEMKEGTLHFLKV